MFTPTFNHHRCLRLFRSRRFNGLGAAVPALILALVLGFWAQPALAFGEDIQIVSESQRIHFPDEVEFGLIVESTAEITEVRLFFRHLVSRSWTYAYLSFEPGKRVTANLKVNTAGGNYLPPGAKLEYYYLIRDAAGNVLETPPSVFEFIDNRFQWEQAQIGPLLLTYHDLPVSRVPEIEGQISEALDRLMDLLQTTPGVPIQGVIYNNRDEALEAFPFQSETISESGVFQGFAFANYGIFVGIGLEPRLIVHESAHLLLHQALGPKSLDLPAWLNEGFASYMEPDSILYGSSGLRDDGLPLRAMFTVSGTPSHIGTFYLKSESVVGFLIENRGVPAFQRLLIQLRLGKTVDEALMVVYGFDTSGLETVWADEATGPIVPRHNPNPRPSPFLYLDSWVYVGLVLLVIFSIPTRWMYRRIKGPATVEWGFEDVGPGEGLDRTR